MAMPGILRFTSTERTYRVVLVAVFFFLAIFVTSSLTGQSASASMATNSRLSYGNAGDYCYRADNGPGYFASGMVWLSNDESDYYAETVSVGATATSVSVSIRGAVNTCNTIFGGATDMYAINVSTSYLSGLSGNSFYRGTVPGGTGFAWSSAGSKLYGTLNVASYASCSAAVGGIARETIYIGITRQQRQIRPGYDWTSPIIGTEWVPVAIARTCPPWSTSATTTRTVDGVNTGTGTLGQVIRWQHTLNLLQNPNPVGIYSQTFSSGFSNGWNGAALGATAAAGRPVGVIRTITSSTANRTQHTIGQPDVGNTLCQQLQWDPTNSSGGRDGRSTNQCVTVPYTYTLTPSITNLPPSTVVESDNRTVPVTGRVSNNGPTKSQPNINWRITQVKYSPGTTTIPNQAGGTGTTTPCGFFTGNLTCNDSLASGTEASGYGFGTVGPNNPLSSQDYNAIGQLSDDPPGTKICYAMSIQPYTHTSATNWRHSQLYCLIIGKQPKVQVHGSNIQTGRTFSGTLATASTVSGSVVTKAAGGTYGSWAEYGIFAPSAINLVASGAGLNIPTGNPDVDQDRWSAYSFTKGSGSNNYGSYTYSVTSLPDVTTIFPRDAAVQATNFNVSTTAKGRSIRPADGSPRNIVVNANPVTPAAPTLTSGQWLVINAEGHNVTIASNIEYANGPFTNAAHIPQLVIVADNITIAAGVSRVDAWLVAKNDTTPAGIARGAYGAIATCDQQAGPSGTNGIAQWLTAPNGAGTNYTASNNARLTIDHCNTQLRINGPVVATTLYLRRTAGSGPATDSGTPAEIINLRPDASLWARAHMSPGRIYQNVNERELPPRY